LTLHNFNPSNTKNKTKLLTNILSSVYQKSKNVTKPIVMNQPPGNIIELKKIINVKQMPIGVTTVTKPKL